MTAQHLTKYMQDLGAVMKTARCRAKVSEKDMARTCRVTIGTVQRWEKSEEVMTMCDLWRFCRPLHMDPMDMLLALVQYRQLRTAAEAAS